MQMLWGLVILGAMIQPAAFAQDIADPGVDLGKYLTVQSAETTEVGTHAESFSTISSNPMPESVSTIPTVTDVLANPLDIAGTVFKVWDIIQANKPTLSVDSTAATALPYAANQNWQVMSGWQERAVHFQLKLNNLYHSEVINLEYDLKLLFNGSIKGKGQYIASAKVQPSNINVHWGYNLNVKVSVASIYNAGTEDFPVGAINLDVQYAYSTMLTNRSASNSYLLRGDGLIQDRNSGQIFYASVAPPAQVATPTPSPTPTRATVVKPKHPSGTLE